MKRLAMILVVFAALVTTAYADFNAGLDAYLKEDYRTALKEFSPLAEQGHADSQYMLGYLYAAGKGVLQDYVRAHAWFNLAAAQGKTKAATSRDEIAKVMTPSQIAEAQKLARDWQPGQVDQPAPKKEAIPEEETPSPGLIRAIQENLAALGYDPGSPDGQPGRRTQSAILKYQQDAGLASDGRPSQELLDHLKGTRAKVSEKLKAEAEAGGISYPPGQAGAGGPTSPQTREVLDRLKKLVEKGSRQRLADRAFLADLNRLIYAYDWPWSALLLQDDFADRDFTKNPTWTVVSGNFSIDAHQRLLTWFSAPPKRQESPSKSKEDPRDQLIKTILGEIMKDKGKGADQPQQPPPPSKAEIYSSLPISNAFAIDIAVSVLAEGPSPTLEFGPYVGRERSEGYRLAYSRAKTPILQLTRRSSAGSSVIDASEAVPSLGDGKTHLIRWCRYEDGTIRVLVDGKEVLETRDRTFPGVFDGFTLGNYGGKYAVPRLSIYGTNK